MSLYNLVPSPAIGQESFAYWQGGFSQNEIYQIRNIGEKLITENSVATVGDNIVNPEIRRSKVAWLKNNDEASWIYDKLGFIARRLNGQYFNFDMYGFVEDLQYTVYDGSEQGFYDWHMDQGPNTDAPRKISLVIQLSSPDEYEGGDLELLFSGEPMKTTKELGILYAFPSWIMHRVTPVTKGTRRTMVVWLSGPRFR